MTWRVSREAGAADEESPALMPASFGGEDHNVFCTGGTNSKAETTQDDNQIILVDTQLYFMNIPQRSLVANITERTLKGERGSRAGSVTQSKRTKEGGVAQDDLKIFYVFYGCFTGQSSR